mmetsp:Transcript_57010/g.130902  ORF Transcript_57010/g.130902 Transcript_57010/m.130902 type:complete len:180 (-) Transcript_57010:158-697(-)
MRTGAAALAVALVLLVIPACAPIVDEEYQKWALREHNDRKLDENDSRDKEAMDKGRSIACALCNVLVMATVKHFEKALSSFSEESTLKRLKALCEKVAPATAQSMELNPTDALMICKRLVNENASDLLDLLSVGDSADMFCKDEVGVCDMGYEKMMHMSGKFAEFAASQKTKDEMKDEV